MLGIVTTPLLYAYSGLKTLGNCVLDIPQAVKQAFERLSSCFTSEYASLDERKIENCECVDATGYRNLYEEILNPEEIVKINISEESKSIKESTILTKLLHTMKTNNHVLTKSLAKSKFSFISIGEKYNNVSLIDISLSEAPNLILKEAKAFLNKNENEQLHVNIQALLGVDARDAIVRGLNDSTIKNSALRSIGIDPGMKSFISLTKDEKTEITHKFYVLDKVNWVENKIRHQVTAVFDVTDPENITFSITCKPC